MLTFFNLPSGLELSVDATHPVSEVTSSALIWTWGNFVGVVLILGISGLQGDGENGFRGGLIVIAVLVCGCAGMMWIFRDEGRRRVVGGDVIELGTTKEA